MAVAADTSATTRLAPSPVPADEPVGPVCGVCGGAGFVRRERVLDDPRFGRADPCACVLQETADVRRSRLERISNLGSLTRFTFAAFEAPSEQSPADSPAAIALRFAHEPDGWLVLTGPSGGGKTHLAAAIANERIANGEPVLFMVVPDLLDGLRASYSAGEGEPGFDDLFEQVRSAPLLILDDIDAAAPSDWAREKLFQLVNARYNATLPTVFTCAALPGSLDQRVVTRLADRSLSGRLDLSQAPAERYREIGGMTRTRLDELGFHNFHTPNTRDDEAESLRNAFQSAKRFAQQPEGWFVLQGTNGCGKTHLAAAVAGELLRAGTDVYFVVVPDLLDHLRASFAPSGDRAGYDELFDQVRNAGLLVLDDFGAQTSSPWAIEKLFQITNYRASTRQPTVITTDLLGGRFREAYPRVAVRALDPQMGQAATILAGAYRLPGRVRPQRR